MKRINRPSTERVVLAFPFTTIPCDQFTGLEGALVSIEDTIKGFNMILNGELDKYLEAAFNLRSIEEVIEAGEKMLAEA